MTNLPPIMYGTAWKEDSTSDLTFLAIQSGFRAIDTANQRKHYYEEGVGKGLLKSYDEGLVKREDLFLQTKYTFQRGQDHRLPYDPKADFATQVQQSFTSSLNHLHTAYLDSYILHGPSNSSGLNDADWQVWRAMENLQKSGKTKKIGVSNINLEQLETLIDKADIKPAFVQNRCFAEMHWDKQIREICMENKICYQGFSLITANYQYLVAAPVKNIAIHYQKTIPQIVFKFAQQIGMLPLTGTTNPEHMRHDLNLLGFSLKPNELEVIETIVDSPL